MPPRKRPSQSTFIATRKPSPLVLRVLGIVWAIGAMATVTMGCDWIKAAIWPVELVAWLARH